MGKRFSPSEITARTEMSFNLHRENSIYDARVPPRPVPAERLAYKERSPDFRAFASSTLKTTEATPGYGKARSEPHAYALLVKSANLQ